MLNNSTMCRILCILESDYDSIVGSMQIHYVATGPCEPTLGPPEVSAASEGIRPAFKVMCRFGAF